MSNGSGRTKQWRARIATHLYDVLQVLSLNQIPFHADAEGLIVPVFRVYVSDNLPSLPLLDFCQPLIEEFSSAVVKRVRVDIQRSNLERRFKRAWDCREDYIPE